MIDVVNLGRSGGKKNRLQLNYFAIAFGATIELEYEVVEEGEGQSTQWVTLESGDAFVVNSLVKRLQYRVKRTTNQYGSKLVLRDGCLLL